MARTERTSKVPARVAGVLDAIRVRLETGRMTEHNEYGRWEWATRTVTLDASLTGRALWQVFYHELVHAALSDCGVQLTKEQEEAVCDAIATARVREQFG